MFRLKAGLQTLPHIKISDHQLEYAWHGPRPDEAPTLVFLHEGLGCVAMWKDFPERVSEATGCGALVYSRSGYGNSDRCELPHTVRFIERVTPLIDHPFDVNRVHTIG